MNDYQLHSIFNARYYDSEASIWLSVDPMADERSWVSPYSYCQNNPVMRVNPTGALDDNYSVDKQGNVKLEEKTNDKFDMLYTKSDWDAGNKDNGLKVNDQSILSGLATSRSDYYCKNDAGKRAYGNYTTSSSKSDIFNVFYFVANNSDVEWGLDGFWNGTRTSKSYFLGTNHLDNKVSSSTNLSGFNQFDQFLDIHVHPYPDGTKGASLCTALGGDMCNITNRYWDYKDAGMKHTSIWFKNGKNYSVFPRHYVYHKHSHTLYHYTPYNVPNRSNTFIRNNINSGSDMYRNLSF